MGDIFRRNGLWWWRVIGKGGKYGDIPVSEELLDALQRYRDHLGLASLPATGEAAAGLPHDRSRAVQHAVANGHLPDRQAGIPAGRHGGPAARSPASAAKLQLPDPLAAPYFGLSPAGCRRTQGCWWLSQNLRHASIQTTRKYLHTEDDARHEATQALLLRRRRPA